MRRDLRLGAVADSCEYEINRSWIDRFAAAFEASNPLWHDEESAGREGRFNAMVAPSLLPGP